MSLAFGAVAFNEMFPVYVALIPVAVIALMLSPNRLSLSLRPRGLPIFLIACGLALSLLGIAALLLPMMVLQTIMQLHAGVSFGTEAAAPFLGFTLISAGAIWFLVRLSRIVSVAEERAAAP